MWFELFDFAKFFFDINFIELKILFFTKQFFDVKHELFKIIMSLLPTLSWYLTVNLKNIDYIYVKI